eukprot:7555551-Alexandrium_andersonii.AAC.1
MAHRTCMNTSALHAQRTHTCNCTNHCTRKHECMRTCAHSHARARTFAQARAHRFACASRSTEQ